MENQGCRVTWGVDRASRLGGAGEDDGINWSARRNRERAPYPCSFGWRRWPFVEGALAPAHRLDVIRHDMRKLWRTSYGAAASLMIAGAPTKLYLPEACGIGW